MRYYAVVAMALGIALFGCKPTTFDPGDPQISPTPEPNCTDVGNWIDNIDNSVTLVRGPYLQMGSPEAVRVRWRTDAEADARVAFGLAPDDLSWCSDSSAPLGEQELQLDNLLPDTTYYYAVGTATGRLVGADADHFFVTPPAFGTPKDTRIWFIGDAGTANDDQAAVRDAFLDYTKTRYTDLWIMLGDNAYDDGTDDEYQDAVFDVYPTLLRQTVVWATLGNHDGHEAQSGPQTGPYYDIFSFPKSAEVGGTASGTEAYYSFDYGNIHFVCLDSYDTDNDPDSAMMLWLEADLSATTQEWIIAYWHHPPYTKGSHDSDSEGSLEDMRTNALPVLESHGVDLVLSGHSHSYERSFLLDGHYGASDTLDASHMLDAGDGQPDGTGAYRKTAAAVNDGAVYIVAGSSGKTSSASLDHPAMYASLESLGSVVVDVSGPVMTATFIDDTGATLDYFVIDKN